MRNIRNDMNLIKRGSRVIKNISLLALISMGASATVQANQAVQTNQTISSNTAREPSNINFSDNDVEVKTIAEGLNKPWGLHYLQNRGFLITERDGGVRFYDSATNTLSLVNKQFVERVYESGQGGMLDVIAHPEFESNYWVYVTFSSGHRFSNATTG
jgi:aldose sugar dehydrogenase